MLRVLLAKDLRRVWRNPLPALINIALPLCITALIGLAFGGRSENELGHIRFAFVDEDQSALSGFFRSAVTGRKSLEHLEPVFVDRETALRGINDNKLSAALIIPTNFSRDYFKGSQTVGLELIKNPAQSMQPAVLEELAAVVVSGMNALSRNFQSQFPKWRDEFEGEVDQHKIATIVERIGNKFDGVKNYILPPLVGYEKEPSESAHNQQAARVSPTAASSNSIAPGALEETRPAARDIRVNKSKATNAAAPATPGAKSGAPASEPKAKPPSYLSRVFAWVLVGMSAMFLLFLASNAMADLQRELQNRTFERYQTLREQLLPFVGGKVVFAVVFLLLCSAIMIGAGGIIFRVQWQKPLALVALTFAYACCAAGLMATVVALFPDERRAGMVNTVIGMVFGMAGGCMFPTRQLPYFMREHITPLLPTYWFVNAARELQYNSSVPWQFVSLKLIGLSAVLMVLAVLIFQRRFKRGLRG